METARENLRGKRIFVVEDMLVVAQEIEQVLFDLGCEIVGPIPTLDEAIERAETEDADGAVLDVNLDGREAYPIADRLRERGVPFLFLTGYDQRSIPEPYRSDPRLDKPFSATEFASKLEMLLKNSPENCSTR